MSDWVIYYLETDDDENEIFYECLGAARDAAAKITRPHGHGQGLPLSATVSRLQLKKSWLMRGLGGVLDMLNRDGYFEHTEVIATYTDGKEVPSD